MKKIFQSFLLLFLLIRYITSILQFNFTVEDIDKKYEKNPNLISTSNKMKSFLDSPIESELDARTTMNVCLGSEPQCFDLIIQTNSFYILVSDINSKVQKSKNKFDFSKSATIVRNSKEVRLNYYGQRIIGTEAKDLITIGGTSLSRVNFVIVQSSGRFRQEDGFIGLGFTPSKEEKKFSIIQQLFENGDIPHKVFSQKYTNNFNGVITIGSIPDYIVDDYIHYGRCQALDKIRNGEKYKNNNWECNLDALYIGTDIHSPYYFEGQEVSFLSYRLGSFMPKKIFKLMKETLLKDVISNGKCTLIEEKNSNFYECDKDTEIESLSLIFNNWEIRFDNEALFGPLKENNKKDFIFSYKDDYEKFLIGRSLLKTFEMVYDYANKQIGFYHPSVKYLGREKISPPKVYDFLEEDNEFAPQKVENGKSLVPTVDPEETKKNNINDVDDVSSFSVIDFFRKILEIAIISVAIIIILFFIFYLLRSRKKNAVRKAKKYMKKEILLENRI